MGTWGQAAAVDAWGVAMPGLRGAGLARGLREAAF